MNENGGEALLTLRDIHTYYGKSHILQGISLKVNARECVTLLGRNGAGKTTTLRSIIGLNPPQKGGIHYRGARIDGKRPHEITRLGIGYVPEDRQIFSTLTVSENLNLTYRRKNPALRWTRERIFDTFPRLAERRNNRGNQLSGGEQQMLSIARVLIMNPSILILDEPTEGLAPLIVEQIVGIIKEIKEDGLTILLVEQNVAATEETADRYYILQQGRIVYTGDNREFWERPELQTDYLGV